MEEYLFLDLGKVKSIGFDLDGTLYSLTEEMNNRIRNKVSERILEKKPELGSLEKARHFFELEYQRLHSGTKVIKSIGYNNPGQVMNECLGSTDITDLIEPNNTLAKKLEELSGKYETYMLSNGPKNLALKKLERIGINPLFFYFCIFNGSYPGVTKEDGTGFDKALELSKFPAENHLYVGDREKSDVVPARGKGMQAILVRDDESNEGSIENILQRLR